MRQFRFVTDTGEFDYKRYRDVQEAGNRQKLGSQWVDEASIEFLAKLVLEQIPEPKFALCHGTRRGNEQLWFSKHLPGCKVIGTEISPTGAEFPMTEVWDFHDVRDEWVGKADFVYSNSWDHGYDPIKMFTTWLGQLHVGGLLLIEHSKAQRFVTEMDPFGATVNEVVEIVTTLPTGKCRHRVIDDGPSVRVNSLKRSGGKEIAVNYMIFEKLE